MPEVAQLAAKITVLGADKAVADVKRVGDTVDQTGRRIKTSGKEYSAAFDGVKDSVATLNQGLGFLGLSIGAGTIAHLGGDAVKAANGLERTDAVVRAISGSTARYNEVLRLAREQQDLFGGSLQQNLDGLRGLIPLSKNAGVELEALSLAARQLAASSPEQGASGAAFALREFLSGDTADALISLADRFELPKAQLRAIKAETKDAGEQIRLLTELLNQQGYTAEAVAAQTDTTAHAYTDLGAELSNLQDRVGSLLAQAFMPLAIGTAGVAKILNGDLRGGFEAIIEATSRAQGYSEKETEARKQETIAWLEWLGVMPEAVPSLNDVATSTDAAATAATYYADRIADAVAATRQFGNALSDAARAVQGGLVDALSDAIDRQSHAVEVAERALRPYQQAVEDASDAVRSGEDAVRQAEAGLRPFQDALRGAERAAASAEDAVHNAERGLRPFEDAVRRAEDALRAGERAVADAVRGLRPFEDAVRSASDAVAEKEKEIRDAERGLGRYEDAVDRANKRLERQRHYTDEAKQAFDDLKNSISDTQREIDRLKGAPLVGDAERQAQLDAIEDERNKLELALVQARRRGASDEEIKGLEKQLEELDLRAREIELADKVANDADRRKIERFGESLEEMTAPQILAELERQQRAVDDMTERLGPAEQAWRDAADAQDAAERSLRRSERALERQKEAIEPLRDELGTLKDRLDNAKAALEEQDRAIDPLRENLDGLRGNVDDARLALEEQNRAIDPLRENLGLLKDRVDDAREALEEQDRSIDPLRDNLNVLKERLDDANTALENQDKLIDPLRDKLIGLRDKESDLNIQLGDQKDMLPGINTELDVLEKRYANLATATDAAAAAQGRYNDALRNSPSAPDYINVPRFQPGGDLSNARGGTINNGIMADDPRPSQAGIDTVVQGGTLGDTFDADRGKLGVHGGLDLRIADGSPVHAPLDLINLYIGSYSDPMRAGVYVQGTDRKGRRWYFGHLGSANPRLQQGGSCAKGTVLGWVAAGMGHTHVQLQRVPAPAGQELIDPSAALEESALGAHMVGDITKWDTDAATPAASQDAVRAVEDAAYVIDVSVDALRKAAGYKSSEKFGPAMQALKQDLTLALQTLMDIAAQFSKEGVEAGSEFSLATEDMLGMIIPAIQSMQALKKYEGIAPNLLDWFGADLRLVIDKLLDVAHYYQTDGVVAAAELYDALQPVLGVIDTVVARVEYFRDYQGLMPNLLDWFGADARLLVDKMLDIAQYYNSDGVRAAAEVMAGATETLKPIQVVIATVDSLRQYKGFAPTILDWIGGDMRAIVDKVVDVARYTGEGKEAGERLNETLLAIGAAMQTGMSLSDAVRNYQGADNQAEMLFGDLMEFTDSITDYMQDIRREGVRPALQALSEQMYLGGLGAVEALANGLTSDLGSITAAGKTYWDAFVAGWGPGTLPAPTVSGINDRGRSEGLW